MPVSDLVRKELDIAAQAAVDKLGTDLVAIDLSDQEDLGFRELQRYVQQRN